MIKKLFVFIVLIYPRIVFADTLFSQTITGGCDTNFLRTINNKTKMEPVFEPIEYTCSNGTFLPANTTGCQICPDGYTCIDGTYSFNKKNAQGITTKEMLTQDTSKICSANILHTINNKTRLISVFEPVQIHCNTGYYLGENDIECTICPADHYCPGGTYSFNETTPQGITSCVDSFAPAGMWLASQCGRKLHVGDDVLYLHLQQSHPTQHQLHVSYNNVTYSANAVPRDTNSNTFPKMSNGATHGLHVMIGNVEYLVCDDSVPECRGE